jgi:hypothetical protein
MMLDCKSIIEGTWSSGDGEEVPAEMVDFKLMEAMHWSWEQLQRTPPYVRKYCVDILNLKAEHANEQAEEERRKANRSGGL